MLWKMLDGCFRRPVKDVAPIGRGGRWGVASTPSPPLPPTRAAVPVGLGCPGHVPPAPPRGAPGREGDGHQPVLYGDREVGFWGGGRGHGGPRGRGDA